MLLSLHHCFQSFVFLFIYVFNVFIFCLPCPFSYSSCDISTLHTSILTTLTFTALPVTQYLQLFSFLSSHLSSPDSFLVIPHLLISPPSILLLSASPNSLLFILVPSASCASYLRHSHLFPLSYNHSLHLLPSSLCFTFLPLLFQLSIPPLSPLNISPSFTCFFTFLLFSSHHLPPAFSHTLHSFPMTPYPSYHHHHYLYPYPALNPFPSYTLLEIPLLGLLTPALVLCHSAFTGPYT
ncbi:hypothetical protein E2C01_079804 [Portunus trituberculatus]|uniref:Uncharacterized protein n=1 Tax=Portunus trituberculatus TaxID=210409 RepID=A0A5B7ITS1_PORTR|nr:hypothetical protein [Portunus trituberculatus]